MRIFNFGSCNIDYVYKVNHIVSPGETQTSYTLNIYPGGKGLNQSIAVSRAGTKVYHVGCIGDDGDMLINILQDNKVDISNIKLINTKNGHAIIQVAQDGENAIFLYPGSNHMITCDFIDSATKDMSRNDILILQNEINNLEYIIDHSYSSGIKIVLNPSPFTDNLKNIDYNKISYLILNKLELRMLTEIDDEASAMHYMINRYPGLKIVLTLGKNGCYYKDSTNFITQNAYSVNAIDTTAAGDTFTGYFVSAIANNNPTPQALLYATAASAISVQRNGAAPSIPYMEEVIDFIDNYGGCEK